MRGVDEGRWGWEAIILGLKVLPPDCSELKQQIALEV